MEKLGLYVKCVIGFIWKEFFCIVDKDGDVGSFVVLVFCSFVICCVEFFR